LPSDVWAQLTRQPISEYRDMAAAKIAGHLFRHSCDYQLVLGLLHAWNSAWYKPPLGYHELTENVDRLCSRQPARIHSQLKQSTRCETADHQHRKATTKHASNAAKR